MHHISNSASCPWQGPKCGLFRRSFWNTSCGCLFSTIPDEILLYNIFTYLPLHTVCVTLSVCTRWRHLSGSSVLWSKVDLSEHAGCLNDVRANALLQRHGVHMSTLKLCNARHLTPSFMSNFAHCAPHLRELHLCSIPLVMDSSVKAITQVCTALESLSLNGCTMITDDAIQMVCALPSLRELSMRQCNLLVCRSVCEFNGPQSCGLSPYHRCRCV